MALRINTTSAAVGMASGQTLVAWLEQSRWPPSLTALIGAICLLMVTNPVIKATVIHTLMDLTTNYATGAGGIQAERMIHLPQREQGR